MRNFIRESVVLLSLLTLSAPVFAGQGGGRHTYLGLSSVEIDQLVLEAMETFTVPGIAIGIIKDGKVIHAKGYGVREVGGTAKVTEETLFSIGSTGKSFTAASLALLVDEGKIRWEDKVIDHIPEFQLYDPWVTREFAIRDLLIHNSGLGQGAGDLMVWPSTSFSRKEIISNLKHLKPVSSFRSKYAYDNLLYIVAGEVIAAASGISYEDFVDRRILGPLNMKHCAANRLRLKGHKNIADPHMMMDGTLIKVSRLSAVDERSIIAASGGILCSVASILKWHEMHLKKGRLPNGDVFLSEAQQTEIMTPQTIMPVSPSDEQWFKTSFSAYGLGWNIYDFHGYKIEQHGGGLPGMLSLNAMIPELGIGIAIYTNQQATSAGPAIMYQILEAYISDKRIDWISRLDYQWQERLANAANAVPDLTKHYYSPTGSIDRYAGIYEDLWFGGVVIINGKDGLSFRSIKSERLVGKLEPYESDIFIVRWDDRTLEADAYVKFITDFDGNPQGIAMKAVSPLTDFSFDFHDLSFKRAQESAR